MSDLQLPSILDLPPPTTLGGQIDHLYVLRETVRQWNKQIESVKASMAALEEQIMDNLKAQDLMFGRGSKASATISESVVPTVVDWDEAHEYILNERAMFLVERRMSAAPWNELRESGVLVPGTEEFTKRKLSVRKVSK